MSAISSPTTASSAKWPIGRRRRASPRASPARSPITAPGWRCTCETDMTPIPQTDPRAAYLAGREAIDAAVKRVLESGWYIGGAEVEAFEAAFAAMIGVGHGIGCANGTDAIE